MKRISIILIALFSITGSLLADEDVSIKAEAPKVVRKGQQFRLVYTINNKVDDFQAPSIDQLLVLAGPSTSTSTNISIVNGEMTRKFELKYTYVLQGNETGKFTIPPAKVEVDGKIYQSDALEIEVIEGKASQGTPQSSGKQESSGQTAEAPGDKLFVRVLLSDRNVYREEPIVATLKLYSKLRVSNLGNVKFPDFNGFYKQEIPTPDLRQLTNENVNGEIYQTGVLKKYLLFPQRTGEITIEPFELEFIVQKRVQSSSRSIFDDFFGSYRNVKMPVASEPVKVNVRSLPGNKPAAFKGGVGSFTVETSLDKNQVKTNEGVNLKIRISGRGNLKVIDAPDVNFPPDLETYDPKVTDNIDVSEAGARGYKEYEYLVIPRHAGEYRIPSIEFAYFDLSSRSYKTLKTEPVKLQVEKGEGDTTGNVTTSFAQKDVSMIGSDIRYIKTGEFDLNEKGSFLFGSFAFYAVFVIGIILFFGVFIFFRKKARENADAAMVKNKKANKFARKRLKEASRHLQSGDKEAFYEETLKALWGYLSDKLGIPAAELSREKAREKLEQKHVEESLTGQFLTLIDECEFARYAPSSGEEQMDELFKKAIGVISQLQQKLK